MQKISKYMHLPHKPTSIAYICQNMQKICKICKHEIYMNNMHSPLCDGGLPARRTAGQGGDHSIDTLHITGGLFVSLQW